ncbi:MAG: hypothetical protein L6R38_002071 [Xanthoria sp. 2 TBL-2021]|nr:MAG: hypothetical protein L6R38_002071 [Xanthoria sp. 2 TBL-2021]
MPSAKYRTTVDLDYPDLIPAHQPLPQASVDMQLQPPEDPVTSLVTGILACYVQLSQLPTLRPSSKVNGIFEDLVHLCCVTSDEDIAEKVLTHPKIINIVTPLRCLCSIGEYQLEAHWTERILGCGCQKEASVMFLNFPYYDNYLDLVRMELNALASVTRSGRPRKFAVLGSGPLPMTALSIVSQSMKTNGDAVVVHNVDRDPWAITKSSALCRRLGYRLDQVSFQCVEVEDQTLDLHGFDVVYLAGLVGTTSEQKQSVVAQVAKQMSPGAMLLLRSAHRMRSLLYPNSDVLTPPPGARRSPSLLESV